jgi:molecular chaperone HtpG
MVQGKLNIHTENILPIIKKWLYSDKEIFLRELVANACDALSKLKIMKQLGQVSFDDELRVDLSIDSAQKILTISDTGIGMTDEEIIKYIAQIAFSGAKDFVTKYQHQTDQDPIIGHFGLGFYSAYMVAKEVSIDTLSYQAGATPTLWKCDGSVDYTLETGSRKERGTTISLAIDEASEEYLNEERLRSILLHYCAFLPFPIYLNGKRVNDQEPIWMKNTPALTEKEYINFYHTLYPTEPDPVFWVHLSVEYPFHLQGILFFPKIARRFDWEKCATKLFCNRVFVSENCREILPDFLSILRGVIDSPDIPLNVSRSYLQSDRTVRSLRSHIAKKVADRLASLYATEKEKFCSIWSDLEMVVKLGILQDEKFYEKAKEFLIWKSLSGKWLTIEECRSTDNKIFYTSDEAISPQLLELYRKKEIEIVIANTHIDTSLMSTLEARISGLSFQRIDGKLDESLLDKSREKTLLDADGKTEGGHIADFFRTQLRDVHSLQIEAKSLASDALPALLVVDEETRRIRDYMALMGQSSHSPLPGKNTFVVNTNSKLVHAIYGLKNRQPELAQKMSQHLYELSLLSQKELHPDSLAGFAARDAELLAALTEITK